MSLRKGVGVAIGALTGLTAFRFSQVKARERNLPSKALSDVDFRRSLPNDSLRQRVVIIGAGVVGVSTAYKLAQEGHQVVVLEPQPKAGEECSQCAAGGMSIQNVVVDRSTWNAVLKCLAPRLVQKLVWGRQDDFRFFQINWASSLSDPFFLRWAWTFTLTSLLPSLEQQEKQRNMLSFTKFAVQDMVEMFEDPHDDMAQKAGYNKKGSLAVSYDEPRGSVETSSSSSEKEKKNKRDTPAASSTKTDPGKNGLTLEPNYLIEFTEEVLKTEPSLRFQAKLPVSAKFEYETKSASSGRFAKELARRCEADPNLDVTFVYNTKVLGVGTCETNNIATGLATSRQRITELKTNRGVLALPADVHVVVAAGAWTPHILALMGLYAPVYPLKGYAMSVSAQQALRENQNLRPQDLPSRIVCDKYMYTTRLGDEIRITSIGEFSEWDTKPTKHVDQIFRREAIRQFPQLSTQIDLAQTYCGHRPYVSDGIILLGACCDTFDKLYVSCGPGSNGWKLAFGSGEVISRLISGQTTRNIQEDLGFDAGAFSPANRVLYAPMFANICRARWNI